MAETSRKTTAVSVIQALAVIAAGYTIAQQNFARAAAIPIGLVVDYPQPGANTNVGVGLGTFNTTGRVFPANCLLAAWIVLPDGTIVRGTQAARDPAKPNNWQFDFIVAPPFNENCLFVITADDGFGQTKQVNVPFSVVGPQ